MDTCPKNTPRPPMRGLCGGLSTFARAVGGRARGAWGAAGAIGWWREGGRVLADGHFVARTSAALSPPPDGKRDSLGKAGE